MSCQSSTRCASSVRQCARRYSLRRARGVGPHPRGHRVLHHRRRRSQGRPVRVLLHRGGHVHRRRSPRHDLRGHRRDGAADGGPGARPRPAVPVCRDHPCRRAAAAGGGVASQQPDALRLSLGGGGLRQRAGHPDLPGTAARTHRHAVDGVPGLRDRAGDHLPAAAGDEGRAVAVGGDRGADHRGGMGRPRHPHRRRHGRHARQPAGVPAARHPVDAGNAADPAAGFGHAGGRGTAGIADDRADRRGHDRHAHQSPSRIRGPGRGERGHRLLRRHGRLRDDRPVGDQREVGGAAGCRAWSRAWCCWCWWCTRRTGCR